MLLGRTLGDRISTKKNKKSNCGGTIMVVTSLVHTQCQMSVCKKLDTLVSRAIKIMKQTFDRSPMVFGWCMHKLREFIHGKGDILLSHSEMLEATNHLTVHGGIDRRRSIFSSQRSTYRNRCRDRFGV